MLPIKVSCSAHDLLQWPVRPLSRPHTHSFPQAKSQSAISTLWKNHVPLHIRIHSQCWRICRSASERDGPLCVDTVERFRPKIPKRRYSVCRRLANAASQRLNSLFGGALESVIRTRSNRTVHIVRALRFVVPNVTIRACSSNGLGKWVKIVRHAFVCETRPSVQLSASQFRSVFVLMVWK